MIDEFEGLALRRRALRDASAENNIDMSQFLSDFYPDRAHFVYELIQNAEDAGATKVSFDLQPDRVVVVHNGTRQFTIADIEAITGLANSTKKDDSGSIGKFGVGFKAVYEYCRRPEIVSGGFSFAIEDVWVPVRFPAQSQTGVTEFTFPFDHPDKPAEYAVEEIDEALRQLGPTTLLFLRHIDTIEIRFADRSDEHISRTIGPDGAVTIAAGGEVTRWLRIEGSAESEDAAVNGLAIAAAFRIEDVERPPKRRGGASPSIRLRPLDHGETCVFFPAKKEVSGLKFHIHAPFASTPARDTLKDGGQNDELAAAIGTLIAKALPDWCETGLLDDGALAALPNQDDALSPRYSLIRDRIVAAFSDCEITPVHGGGFARATELRTGPADLRRALSPVDLGVLLTLEREEPGISVRWLAGRKSRAQSFLQSLRVEEFGWEEFDSLLYQISRWKDHWWSGLAVRGSARWVDWLDSLPDPALGTFYEILGAAAARGDVRRQHFGTMKLVRESTRSGSRIVVGDQTHLPAKPNDKARDRVPHALAYFPDDEPSSRKSALETFYSITKTRRWDNRARINARLDRYRKGSVTDVGEGHIADIIAFAAHLAAEPKDLDLFRGVPLLWAINDNDPELPAAFTIAEKAYLDAPYTETGFRWTHATTHYRLSPIYAGRVEAIEEFAVGLGAVVDLSLQEVNPLGNPSFHSRWKYEANETVHGSRWDWDLPQFEAIVESRDPVLLAALWQLACTSPSSGAQAMYQRNKSSLSHPMPSRIAQKMMSRPWILGRNGALNLPREISQSDLPEGWQVPSSTSLAAAVQFGKDATEKLERNTAREGLAEKLGVNLGLVDRISALSGNAQEEVFARLDEIEARKAAFPNGASADAEHRATIAGKDATQAAEFQTEKREHLVVKGASEVREQARTYLRALYTDDQDEMYCQLCHDRMPFRVANGSYFVAAALVGERKFLHPQNHLALCPLCSALFKYVLDTGQDVLSRELLALHIPRDASTVDLPISVNKDRRSIRFAAKHAIDVQALLQVAGEARDEQ